MIWIKNLKGGWLIITDAGLKLKSGQVASVESLSPQIQGLIDRGYVALVDTDTQKEEHGKQLPPFPEEKSAQSRTSFKDGLSHSYKTDDTIHFDGQIDKTRILVSINGKEAWITDQAFHILLRMGGQLKSDHAGWVHGSEFTDGNYHVATKRLKKQISPNLKDPASEFIENNGRGSYRISTHPRNISFNETKIKTLHRETWIQELLKSTG